MAYIKSKELCSTPYCRNLHAPGRLDCHKCKSRKHKLSKPHSYFFNLLRCNAKRRNKSFSLTIEQFKEFCNRTDYLNKKGKKASSFSIDRIDVTKGYHIDNIQVLTLSENSIKRNEIEYPF